MVGRQICRAKAAWMRAQKQPPARAGDCAQAAPMGERRTSCAGWCREASARAAHQGRGHAWAQKTAPSGGRGLCADCAMGERRAMGGVWCREGARGCVQAAPMGEWQAMGAGKAPHWAPAGAEGIPGAKTAPGGGRGLCAGCAMGGTAGNEGVWCRESTALGARWDRGTPGRKNSPRRAPEAVWMRDMGVTCPGRSV